ncbi:MAG: glycosyltransferase family 39 protein [Candidatus Krumholzibacteriaceae bacterium]|jgi:4-amino-4-deoxy-L-arabinose transferase-like glycosyltransferase
MRTKRHIAPGSRGERRIERHVLLVALFFAAGLLARLVLAFRCRAIPNFSDMAEYNYLAAEGTFNPHRPPLYPLFLRAIYALCGQYNYTAVFVVQSLISSGGILLMYWTVSRMWNRRAGLIAAALYAVYPNLIMYDLTTLTESLSVFIVIAMMAVATSKWSDGRTAVVQAVAAGIGMLIKPAFLFFVPGLLVTVKKRVTFVVVLACICAPWILYNAVHTHRLILVSDTGALNFYMSYNPEAKGGFVQIPDWENVSQGEYVRMGLDFIRQHKLRTIEIIHTKIYSLFELGWDRGVMRDIVGGEGRAHVVMYAYLAVFVSGFVGLARFCRKAHASVVAPVVSYVVLTMLLSIFVVRFRTLIEPLLIAYTAVLVGGAASRGSEPISSANPKAPRRA